MPDDDLTGYLDRLTRDRRLARMPYLWANLHGAVGSYRVVAQQHRQVAGHRRWRLRVGAGEGPAAGPVLSLGSAGLRWPVGARGGQLDVAVVDGPGTGPVVIVGGDLEFTFPSVGLIPVGRVADPAGEAVAEPGPPRDGAGAARPGPARHGPATGARRRDPGAGREPTPAGPNPRRALHSAPPRSAARPGRVPPDRPNPLITLPLGSSRLVITERLRQVRLLPALDVAGTVFRLGSSGLLMMFDAMSWVQREGRDEVRMAGGRLVRRPVPDGTGG